ncbi:MAG: DUF4258 domain-containing protein [Alphaproteobacteria bacterium]|nr:DUF4258 domain-containing protein [Alphaproteobacteria bacterium]
MKVNPRPVRWIDLRSDEAERLIRQRANDTANILVSMHAYERLEERGSITDIDVYWILQKGRVLQKPQKNKKGEWEAIIQKKVNGNRDAAAVTIIFKNSNKLKVKTVMWIDP